MSRIPFAFFTVEERTLLIKAGWEVRCTVAYDGGYRKIIKRGENDFVVESWMDGDAESSNYWEWDSAHSTIISAINRCT